jgi:hypothetical protein
MQGYNLRSLAMPVRRSHTLRITAHHEAAQAVTLYRTAGYVPRYITIVAGHGRLGVAADGGLFDSSCDEFVEGEILSCYAGGHAQRSLDASCGDDGCWDDDEQAADLLRLQGWSHREQELRQQSLDLVQRHQAEIAAVAEELLKVETLGDEEIMIIADAVEGEPGMSLETYRGLWSDRLHELRQSVRSGAGGR